jgi:hypothetical protein
MQRWEELVRVRVGEYSTLNRIGQRQDESVREIQEQNAGRREKGKRNESGG